MCIAALALVLLAVGVATAALVPTGSDFRISNTGPDGNLFRDPYTPAVVYNPTANNYLVVWEEDGAADEQFEIYGQLISATGTEIGSDFRISNASDVGSNRDAFDPVVAYSSSANEFLVVWVSDQLADEQFEIFGQRVSVAGVPDAQGDFRVSNASDVDTNRDAFKPAIDYNPAANQFLVAWEGDQLATDEEWEIFGQRISTAGAEVGADFRISSMDTADAPDGFDPAVAYGSGPNEYLVTWQSGNPASQPVEIFGQRVSATGTELGSDFQISNAGAVEPNRDADGTAVAYSAVANEYLVVWRGNQLPGGGMAGALEVFGQRVSAAGAPDPQGDFRISNLADVASDRDIDGPKVIYNSGTGDYLATWGGDFVKNDQEDAMARRISAAGVPSSQGAVVISAFGGDSNFSRAFEVAAAYNPITTDYLVVWEGNGLPVTLEREVFGHLLDETDSSPPPPGPNPNPTPNPASPPKCKGKPATKFGTDKKDVLRGTPKADVIVGLGGNDKLIGKAGNDLLCGGQGKDTLKGGGGKDKLFGEGGKDVLRGGPSKDVLNGGPGKDNQKQ